MDSLLITLIASLFAGVAATCFTLGITELMSNLEVEKTANPDAKKVPLLIKIFLPFASNLAPVTKMPLFDMMRLKTSDHIVMAGYDETFTPEQFIAVKLLSSATGLVLMLLLSVKNPIIGILLMMALIVYPGAWLNTMVKKRQLEIMKALPNVLDLLTLSVEAGKDFLTALRDILARRRMDALGEELKRTLHEIQLGKQRQAALKALVNRVKLPDLTSVINAIIQAEELGVSIANLLKIQSEQLRSKRFSRAEQLANEAPVKIIIPVVVFIFPTVFIILMGPIIMQALRTFSR